MVTVAPSFLFCPYQALQFLGNEAGWCLDQWVVSVSEERFTSRLSGGALGEHAPSPSVPKLGSKLPSSYTVSEQTRI